MRRLVIGLVGVGGLVAVLGGLAVAQKADATLTLSGGSVAAGIGFSWGKEESRIPGHRGLGDPERVHVVREVIRLRRVDVRVDHPADRLAWRDGARGMENPR
jgi:hypothetical protein